MATEPADRYAIGRALADDVERWLADEPVTAWREPWSRRPLRWTKRHRTGGHGRRGGGAGGGGRPGRGAGGADAGQRPTSSGERQPRRRQRLVDQANADLDAANERERQRFELARRRSGASTPASARTSCSSRRSSRLCAPSCSAAHAILPEARGAARGRTTRLAASAGVRVPGGHQRSRRRSSRATRPSPSPAMPRPSSKT